MQYNIIVVGGGHAGCEACLASARLNNKTLLISGNLKNIADAPCNPSIGGPAKGIVVREIDALGGEMGINTDKSQLQMKTLNTNKGPAVRALRAQIDKKIYPEEMLRTIKKQRNLDILEGMVEDLIIENHTVKGVILNDGQKIFSSAVILTTGTYLRAMVLVGSEKHPSGPHGEKESKFLSTKLKELGFTIQRLKTGTPPRILKSSIDFNKTSIENGDDKLYTFSHDNKPKYKTEDQTPCYLTYTNEKTHQIIKENLKKSSMYGGYVEGIGPRYCPSIEDKIVKFSDKERHQLFIEPESLSSNEMYLQGFSTSMPHEIQEEMVKSLKGLENAVITKYAYAIEYDAIDPRQLKKSLETKLIKNLFTAGQINGTSGYEEAAGQGLIAGINASNKIKNKKPLILKRSESYIGVLIDDLVTKGTNEPYRLLTSRAEYRLLLRDDNADIRLRKKGYKLGLISESKYKKLKEKEQNIKKLTNYLKNHKITTKDNDQLKKIGAMEVLDGITLYNIIKRPEMSIELLQKIKKIPSTYDKKVIEQVEILSKYEGYIKKVEKEVAQSQRLEKIYIPSDIDYDNVKNIATEARQKLKKIMPTSIGQAIRISGINPSDISVLTVYLKRYKSDK